MIKNIINKIINISPAGFNFPADEISSFPLGIYFFGKQKLLFISLGIKFPYKFSVLRSYKNWGYYDILSFGFGWKKKLKFDIKFFQPIYRLNLT